MSEVTGTDGQPGMSGDWRCPECVPPPEQAVVEAALVTCLNAARRKAPDVALGSSAVCRELRQRMGGLPGEQRSGARRKRAAGAAAAAGAAEGKAKRPRGKAGGGDDDAPKRRRAAGAAAAAGAAEGKAKRPRGEAGGDDEVAPASKLAGFAAGARPPLDELLVKAVQAMLWSLDLEVALLDKQWLTVGDIRASLGSERGPATLEGVIGGLKHLLHGRESTGSSLLRAELLFGPRYESGVDEAELRRLVPTALVERVERELGWLANARSRKRARDADVPQQAAHREAVEARELEGRLRAPSESGDSSSAGGSESSASSSSSSSSSS
eukprot:gene4112-8302_t